MIQKRENPLQLKNQEAALISRAKKDALSFGKLYDIYAPMIYRYILSRTGNIQDAQDITSQTFLKALEMLARYHHRGYFSAWLFSIARSKYIDHFRSRHQEEVLMTQTNLESLPDLLTIIMERERVSNLDHLLEQLTDEDLDLLRLRNVAELTFAEMAEILSKREDATKKKYYRLLARLQSQLEEENES
ncbi:MAG: RNA polymerase sigma factor [Anaerolineaceae bacterium]|nr:RNA polymerase sigma factor [Anaerolineaceae bacterium]